MTFYLWTDVKALEQAFYGVCFAMAGSREEAVDLICAKLDAYQQANYGDAELVGKLRAELTSTQPQEFTGPVGHFEFGSM